MNETIRRLTKNSFVLTAGTAVTRLVNFLVTVYIARQLSVAAFGQFSYAYTIFFAFAYLINLGLENLVVREVARHPNEVTPFLSNILGVRLLGWPLGILLVGLLWWQDPTSLGVVIFFFGYSLGSAHILLVSSVFRGLEKMEVQALLLSLQAMLMAVAVVIALVWSDNVTVVAAMYCLAAVVVSLLASYLLRREGIVPRLGWQPELWRKLFWANSPFTVAFVSSLLFERLIVVFISLFTDNTAVAWFNASYFIYLALFNVPLILVAVIFPTMSQSATLHSKQHVEQLFTTIFTFLWASSLPLTVAVIYLAPYIIRFTFGASYAPAVLILRILMVGLPFICIVILLAGVLQTIDAQLVAARGYAGGMLVTLPLLGFVSWQTHNYLLITVSYTIATIILAGLMWQLARKHIQLLNPIRTIFVPITAVFGTLFILQVVPLDIYWTLPFSMLWYAGVLIIGGVLNKEMIFILKISPSENVNPL